MTPALRAISLMVVAMLAFTLNDTCMKLVAADMPLFQAILLRGLPATLVLWAMARAKRVPGRTVTPRDRGIVVLRALADVAATVAFLTALVHLPIANLTAIMQALPLCVAVAAALFLGEPLGPARITAILAGLVGVLIILRPGTEAFSGWSVLGLAAVAAVVIRDIAARRLGRSVSSATVAFATSLAVTVTAAAGVPFSGWISPDPRQIVLIGCAAMLLIVGHLTVVMATRTGDLTAAAPFRYTALVFAVAMGWLAFGDVPDAATLTGGGLVVAAGIAAARSEWRRAATPGAAA